MFIGDMGLVDQDRMRAEVDELLEKLFSLCRSITGNGVRKTLSILREVTDFDVREIPTGTKCYDWEIPEEWNVTDAYVEDLDGKKLIDFKKNNLHLVNYSIAMDKVVSFEELKEHLHTLPQMPEAIPYRTSYYKRDWGFCLAYNQLLRDFGKGKKYHVKIDSSLRQGSLTYGECILKGETKNEFIVSTYCCHPSLANDNLSGMVLWALLLRELKKQKPRNSYRFIICPENIGAIAYLAHNEKAVKNSLGCYVITTVAGPGAFGYKSSYLGNSLIDRAVYSTFEELKLEYNKYPFSIRGSDESRYSSPFFRIPSGTICKDKYYEYKEYHTSLDDLKFISAESLIKALNIYMLAIEKLELNLTYRTLNPHCEPMLSGRGLYPVLGGSILQKACSADDASGKMEYGSHGKIPVKDIDTETMLWLMFYCDGTLSLLDIHDKTALPVRQLYAMAEILKEHKLLKLTDGGKKRTNL